MWLKPCPFCGGIDLSKTESPDDCGGISYSVQCCGCWINGSHDGTREGADIKWNTRTSDLELAKVQEQLRIALEALELAWEWIGPSGETTGTELHLIQVETAIRAAIKQIKGK